MDDREITWATSWDFSGNTHSVRIFGARNNNVINFKIKRFRLYDGSVLVRDMCPCTNLQNEPGMYDLVTGTFYGTAVAGQPFIYGND